MNERGGNIEDCFQTKNKAAKEGGKPGNCLNSSRIPFVKSNPNDDNVKKHKFKRRSKKTTLRDRKLLKRKHNADIDFVKTLKKRKKRKTTQDDLKQSKTLHKLTFCSGDNKNNKKGIPRYMLQEQPETVQTCQRNHSYKHKILKQARKNFSDNTHEYSNFILKNDLIHYIWNPSQELQEHLGLRKGKWTKKEEEILENNVERFIPLNNIGNPAKLISCSYLRTQEENTKWKEFLNTTGFYQELCKGLWRSLVNILQKFVRSFDAKNYLGKYSTAEDDKLLKLHKRYGQKWSKIGAVMGRSRLSVANRYHLIKDRSSYNTGPWNEDEVDRLRKAIRHVTNTQEGEEVYQVINWEKVVSAVKTRNYSQCSAKWYKEICWKDCHTKTVTLKSWSEENNVELIIRIYESKTTEECDIDWYALNEHFEMSRSPSWLRSKFVLLKKRFCTPTDFHNADFEEVIDYLYNVAAVDIQNKLLKQEEVGDVH